MISEFFASIKSLFISPELEMEWERRKRIRRFVDLLRGELRRVLIVISGENELLRESEDDAISRLSRDVRIQNMPKGARERAIEIVLWFNRLSTEEINLLLNRQRHFFHITHEEVRHLLNLHDRISSQARPMERQRARKMTPPPEPPEVKTLNTLDAKLVKEEAKQTEQLRSLTARKIGLYFKWLTRVVLGLAAGANDAVLTYLAIAAAYEGSAWYYGWMSYSITLAVVAAMLWSAHQAMRGLWYGKIALGIGTLILGLIRAGISGDGSMDLYSIAMIAINTLPIPILAYWTVLFFGKAADISADIADINKGSEGLASEHRVTNYSREIVSKEAEAIRSLVAMRNLQIVRDHGEFEQSKQRLLANQQNDAVARLRQCYTSITELFDSINREVEKQMTVLIEEYGTVLGEMSLYGLGFMGGNDDATHKNGSDSGNDDGAGASPGVRVLDIVSEERA